MVAAVVVAAAPGHNHPKRGGRDHLAELFRFAAFISYSSRDMAFARRLHAALESYSIPVKLGNFDLIGGGKRNRIFPVFKDREELPGGNLEKELQAALRASGALIVICSRKAASSEWVNAEIEYFKDMRPSRIFGIIPDTVPLSENGTNLTAECFPPALDDLRLVATDARRGQDGFRNAWLKLIAGLIGVNAGALQDRDRKRRRRQRAQWTAGAATLASVALIAAAWVDGVAWRTTLAGEARRRFDDGRTLDAGTFSVAARATRGAILPVSGGGADIQIQELRRMNIKADLGTLREKPTFSENNRWVATVGANNAGQVIDLRTDRRISLGDIYDPREQPLSATFLFSGGRPVVLARSPQGQSFLVNLETEERTELGVLDFSEYAEFSPDGAFLMARRDGAGWFLRSLDTDQEVALVADPESMTDGNVDPWPNPTWTHALVGPVLVDLATGAHTSIGAQADQTLDFHPSGRLLTFALPDGVLRTMNLASGGTLDFGTPRAAPVFSADGLHAVYVDSDSNIVHLDIAAATRSIVGRAAASPKLALDKRGSHLAFLASDGAGRIVALATGATTTLPALSSFGPFSPAGDQLAFIDSGGRGRIVRADGTPVADLGPVRHIEVLRENEGRMLITGPQGTHIASFSTGKAIPIANGLTYTSNGSFGFEHKPYLWTVYNLETGKSIGLATDYPAQITTDGHHIAYVRDGITIALNPETGRETELPGFGSQELVVRGGWTVGVTPDGNARAYNLATGAPPLELGVVRQTLESDLSTGIELSPDGSFVSFTEGEGRSTLIDLRAPETSVQPPNADVCADNDGDRLRPFPSDFRMPADLSGAATSDESRRMQEVHAILEGRPWNPCDWRGIGAILPDEKRGDGWFEGVQQWWRRFEVSVMGWKERDYICGEDNAAGRTNDSRIESCNVASIPTELIARRATEPAQ